MRRPEPERGNKENRQRRDSALKSTDLRKSLAIAYASKNPISLYKALRKRFGFLHWWPGETKLEILVGAVLTQQTSWKNVEKAIAELKKANCIDLECLARINVHKLEKLIRQSGFYRQKAARLKGICSYIYRNYQGLDKLFEKDPQELRKELLSLNGIGKETADSIILYSAEKPVFVIDAYTRRSMSRITGGAISEDVDYDALRIYFESSIPKELSLYKDFHAQFVELGKNYCRTKPLCEECPLNSLCHYYAKASQQSLAIKK
ncbi:MAG: endonuclease III domain-containing protein [Candidatus Micrarchaeia archaeon]